MTGSGPIDWARHYAAQREQQPGRHTVDTITSDALKQLYARIDVLEFVVSGNKLSYIDAVKDCRAAEQRAEQAERREAETADRAAEIIDANGVLLQRAEQAEAAIERVRTFLDQDQDGLCCSRLVGQVRAALDEPKDPRP